MVSSNQDEEEKNPALEAARLKLRKTRFDYSSDTFHHRVDVTPQQIDFRNVLKKKSKDST